MFAAMTMQSPSPPLARTLGGFQYLAIAIGCMIGIAWITVLGEWLARAGPLGAMLGFVAGGIVMMGVAACYAELTGMMPDTGGDVVFAHRVFGPDAAYLVGWFLILMAVSVASFEALSFVWVTQTLFPDKSAVVLYKLLGETVTLRQVGIGLSILLAMYAINRIGMNASSKLQGALTVFKLAVMFVFIAAGLLWGDTGRLLALAPGKSPHASFLGGLWVAATCAFWLGGFQVISQAAGERSPQTSLRLIGWITTASVAIAMLFYAGVVAAASAVSPVAEIIAAPLPAAHAAAAVFQSRWGTNAVLVAGMAGILATMNAMMLSGSRLAVALAGMDLLPAALARTDRRAAPATALTLIVVLAAGGVVAGRGLLVPVVNMAAISLIISYVLACASVLRLRRTAPDAERPFRVPGGTPLIWIVAVITTAMAVFIILEPWLEGQSLPVEWILFVAWAALGGLVWMLRRGGRMAVRRGAV
jgi:basic amino acid/polyamine antiporter, APA family